MFLVVGGHIWVSCPAALQSEFFEVKTLNLLPLPKVSKVRWSGSQAQALVVFLSALFEPWVVAFPF